ncbi:glucosamine-6-phosphate deaminase [Thalassobacillus sp. CUG 92003]|uniref:glucosamine-6-phosphate deaminase n=1 Tax=Thalassobacillus sp. CUG 92003 TaxID=2736641 RepID=UPI0015E74330|nr:glucosamine-6-phosphate deaminase [Thalassobacillus sp. CUG 92003]
MNVIITEDYDTLSEQSADIITNHVTGLEAPVLGLATGSTPLGTYNRLAARQAIAPIDYRHVSTINLDEYVGLGKAHPQSYHAFMKEKLFDHIEIPEANTHIPDGLAENRQAECERYEQLIDSIGPPDLQVLGIGHNGHIGFNEPGTSFQSETHVVNLAPSTREANARFFSSSEEVPCQAITMGIKSIMKSRKIVLLASGQSKAKAIERLFQEEPNEAFPASVLNQHPNVTLIVDQEAYQLVEQ